RAVYRKSLMPLRPALRAPHWYTIPVRVGMLTFIGTLLSFAFTLLFAIAGLLIVWKMHGVRPNMAVAYRRIALPAAVWCGVVIFILSLITEIRHYRQVKPLSEIERIS